MKKYASRILPAIVLSICFCGCFDDSLESMPTVPMRTDEEIDTNAVMQAQQKATERTEAIRKAKATVKPDDVIIKLDGLSITRGDFERYVDMMVALQANRNPKATDAQKAKLRDDVRAKIGVSYLQRNAIWAKLPEFPEDITTNSEATIKTRYVRSFCRKGQTFEELNEHMRELGYGDLFARDFMLDVKMNAAFNTTYSNRLDVTDEELLAVKNDVREYNSKAEKANLEMERNAAKIIKLARSGADFGALADRYSQDEDREAGGDMGECDENDFANESKAYWQSIARLPEGGISDLLVTEDGYEIVKVIKKLSPEESNSGEPALHLARIFLRRAYLFPEQSDEEFKADVKKEKQAKFLKEFISGIMKESEIEFPCGEEILR